MACGAGTRPACLPTLIERKTRFEITRKIESRTKQAVTHEPDVLERQMGVPLFRRMSKTVTGDNGSKFYGGSRCLDTNRSRRHATPSGGHSRSDRPRSSNGSRIQDMPSGPCRCISRRSSWSHRISSGKKKSRSRGCTSKKSSSPFCFVHPSIAVELTRYQTGRSLHIVWLLSMI